MPSAPGLGAELEERAKALLDQLAKSPRFAGSAEESAARGTCRARLEECGFECREIPFEYSEWPGRWGPPAAAALQAATIFVIARTALYGGPLVALAVGSVLVAGLVLLVADVKRRWIARFPLQRATSVNLEATRGKPKLWLVAHLDSKSQTIPMLFRIASSVALGLVSLLTAIALVLSLVAEVRLVNFWIWIQVAAGISALPSTVCWVRNRSSGSVDNASGVAAVLLACGASDLPRDMGVLITSAEELGLAGARAWASLAAKDFNVVNCDTFDDMGAWRCMYTGQKPLRLTDGAETSAASLGFKLTVGLLIPGILTDSIVFADRGIEAVTLSRGTFSTLARIHTRRDNSAAMTGRGVADGARLLGALARQTS